VEENQYASIESYQADEAVAIDSHPGQSIFVSALLP
jgi:hypothetical protein